MTIDKKRGKAVRRAPEAHMACLAVTKKPTKQSTPKASRAHKERRWIDAMILNGGNATKAASAAGFKPGEAAKKAGYRMSTNVRVWTALEKRRAEAADESGLTIKRTLREVSRVSYFDRRKLHNKDGSLKNPHEWDDNTAAAISHIGPGGPVPFDKNAALEKAMKHLGLYEKDNNQKPVIPVSVRVEFV